jgi:hypothetical protein
MHDRDDPDDARQNCGLELHWRAAPLRTLRQTLFVEFRMGFIHKPAHIMMRKELRNCFE